MLRRALWLVVAGAVGCYQGVDAASSGDAQTEGAEAGEGEDGGDGSDSGDPDDGGEPVDDSCMESIEAPTTIVRQLNRREYANTVRDLVGLSSDEVAAIVEGFPVDPIVGFDNYADSLVASDALVEQQLFAAEAIADAVDPLQLAACDPADAGEAACADALVAAFGRRAFRRPLSPDEHAAISGVYTRARDEGRSFDAALRLVVRSLLVSPRFLYRIETGVADEGGPADVDAFELASRLSYFLWASMPDDALLDAAEAGALGTTEEIEATVRRMLDDPRARQTVAEWSRQWMQLHRLPSTIKDAELVPEFDGIKSTLVAETERSLDEALWGGGGVQALLLAESVYVDDTLASYYGLPAPGSDALVPVPATAQRFGLLTQASVLSQFSNSNRTSPTKRGLFVRGRLLCQEPPPPPGDVPPLPGEVDGEADLRERLEQHVSSPGCSGCHQLIDPIGFGLEHYDLAGRFRTEDDSGASIDASGKVLGFDEGDFTGARELAELLVASGEVEACVATQMFRFAAGRHETSEDECMLDGLRDVAVEHGGAVPEILVAIATSRAFRRRTMEPR